VCTVGSIKSNFFFDFFHLKVDEWGIDIASAAMEPGEDFTGFLGLPNAIKPPRTTRLC
jgi:hypothetical protein